MTTATNIAITSMNANFAAQAQQAANEAHRERCKIEIREYDAQTASVGQMQSYASCVEFVYPTYTAEDAIAWKFVVAALLLCTIVGAVIGAVRDSLGVLYGFLMGAVAGFLVFLAGFGIVAGVLFLFS